MNQKNEHISKLSDDELHQELMKMVKGEHRADADIVAHLIEVMRRRLGARRARNVFDSGPGAPARRSRATPLRSLRSLRAHLLLR